MPEPLDTAVCVIDGGILADFLRGRPHAAALFRRLVREGDVAVSTITQAEVFAAAVPGTEEVTAQLLDAFATVDVGSAVARRAATFIGRARAARDEEPPLVDAITAATALELDLPLVTNDPERYRFARGVQAVDARFAATRA
jgi:predicted nucleic acid-binding protein